MEGADEGLGGTEVGFHALPEIPGIDVGSAHLNKEVEKVWYFPQFKNTPITTDTCMHAHTYTHTYTHTHTRMHTHTHTCAHTTHN